MAVILGKVNGSKKKIVMTKWIKIEVNSWDYMFRSPSIIRINDTTYRIKRTYPHLMRMYCEKI